MIGFIPHDEAAQVAWVLHLARWLRDKGADRGFTESEIAELSAAAEKAAAAVADSEAQQAIARNTAATGKAAVAAAVGIGSAFAERLHADGRTTDEDRARAGLPVRRAAAQMASAAANAHVPPPKVRFEFRGDGEVAVHWGPNPDNEHSNARPSGVQGCAVEVAPGAIPSDEACWVPLEYTTRSPAVHTLDLAGPVAYAYRARYIFKDLTVGPWTGPIVFPIRGCRL